MLQIRQIGKYWGKFLMRILFFFKNNESLGIQYLSALLKKAGHKTDLLFDLQNDEFGSLFLNIFSGLNNNIIDKEIKLFKPDLIAFSAFTNTFPWVSKIAKYIHDNYDIPILLGGYHPTLAPEYVLEKDFVDYICVGDGEPVIIPFVEALEAGKTEINVPGIWYKNGKNIIRNTIPPLIQNLDDLPFPDKDLFYKFGAFTKRYSMVTGRGCPNNCTYCVNHQLHKLYPGQKMVRKRSVDNVIEELKWAKRKYNIEHIHFSDDDFLLNVEWLREFVEKYKKEDFDFKFKILANSKTITDEKVRLVKSINCRLIAMGVESGSYQIRSQILNRKIKDDVIIRASNILHKYKVPFDTFNLINIPTEKPSDMIKTLVLNRKIKPNGFQILDIYPFPNSEIAKICFENKILDENGVNKIFEGAPIFGRESLLKHNYSQLGEQIRNYGFIYVKLPHFMRKLVFRIPSNVLLGKLNLLFSTDITNLMLKLDETFMMALKTFSYYSNFSQLRVE